MAVPIIMLTARDDEADRIVGLEIGADDYLTKPFSMRELMARVKAQLRRTQVIREELEKLKSGEPAPNTETLTFGGLQVNQGRREVTLNSQPLPLKPKEYELLAFFASHRGQMLSREFILERVWGWDYIGDSRTVDVHVRWLRQKIEADPSHPERIVTVRGGGYRFEGEGNGRCNQPCSSFSCSSPWRDCCGCPGDMPACTAERTTTPGLCAAPPKRSSCPSTCPRNQTNWASSPLPSLPLAGPTPCSCPPWRPRDPGWRQCSTR
jgi:DNA-binding response OmpR family regulator